MLMLYQCLHILRVKYNHHVHVELGKAPGRKQAVHSFPEHRCTVLLLLGFSVSPNCCKCGILAHHQLLPVESCRNALVLHTHSDHFLFPISWQQHSESQHLSNRDNNYKTPLGNSHFLLPLLLGVCLFSASRGPHMLWCSSKGIPSLGRGCL